MADLSNMIIEVRGEKVILDYNLAILYGVKAIVLRQSIKRNINRFPSDFMFKLNGKEIRTMVSQNVIPSHKKLGGSTLYAFTEYGVAMLSSVLRSEKAIEMNIMIIRIFIEMRKAITTNSEINLKISAIENELSNHSVQLQLLFEELSKISQEDEPSDGQIGFRVD